MIRWLKWQRCLAIYVHDIAEEILMLDVQQLFRSNTRITSRASELSERYGFPPHFIADAGFASYEGKYRRWRQRCGLGAFQAPTPEHFARSRP